MTSLAATFSPGRKTSSITETDDKGKFPNDGLAEVCRWHQRSHVPVDLPLTGKKDPQELLLSYRFRGWMIRFGVHDS